MDLQLSRLVLQPELCLTPRGMVKDRTGAVGMARDAWESWEEKEQATAFWRGHGECVEDRDGTGIEMEKWEQG